MGYYSYFRFNTIDENKWTKELEMEVDVIKFLNDNKDEYDGYEDMLYAIDGDHCKFYNVSEVMNKLSKEFPDKIFMIDREGEEYGDVERIYYKNGYMQSTQAILSYEPYDKTKLKKIKNVNNNN